MAKQENQKQKLFRLYEILMHETDEAHPLTMAQIIARLNEYGISAERKSIYSDFATLEDLGYPVSKNSAKSTGYYMEERQFELAELKMLVDAVQSSRFITAKKSRELINKLGDFAGGSAHELARQVYVEDRIKTANNATIYSIDAIHTAINGNKCLSFKYFEYDGAKNKVFRHDGKRYEVSPCALLWSEENYYLVAYEESTDLIKNFRVDKMLKTALTDKKPSAEAISAVVDPATYSRRIFGMYGGEDTLVTLEFDERLVGAVIDRFGKDISIIPIGDRFRTSVRVMVSPTFFSWVFSFGGGVSVISPDRVRGSYRTCLENSLKEYEK